MRLSVLVASAVAAATLVGLAPSASAATVQRTVGCSDPNGGYTPTPFEIVASPGDTIVLEGDVGCTVLTIEAALDPIVASSDLVDGVATIVLREDAAPGSYGSGELGDRALGLWGSVAIGTPSQTRGMNFYVTVVASATPTAASPIPAWVQGYGRNSSTESCLAGWAPSWEQWMHAGAGGWVCTRSIPSLG